MPLVRLAFQPRGRNARGFEGLEVARAQVHRSARRPPPLARRPQAEVSEGGDVTDFWGKFSHVVDAILAGGVIVVAAGIAVAVAEIGRFYPCHP